MGGRSSLRSIDDVLLGPVDRVAAHATRRGAKWCEPVSASLPRIMQLLDAANPTPEERAVFAKSAQRKGMTSRERSIERALARRINAVAGIHALSTQRRGNGRRSR